MKRIIDVILKNRLLILTAGVLVIAAGYYSYRQLPIDAFPDVSPSLVQVFTVTEGLAPEEVEKYVTYPVEVAMNGIPRLKNIRSVSNFGLSVVNIYFEDGTDIYFARQLVNERLQEARAQIPEGFGDPQMGPISTGMGLVMFYYLEDEHGKYSLEEMHAPPGLAGQIPAADRARGNRSAGHRRVGEAIPGDRRSQLAAAL